MSTPRGVLIVDDNDALAENTAEILMGGGLGVRIERAATGREALARLGSGSFDLALVDVRLPDVDGTNLLTDMRAASPGTVAVMITGDATMESAIAAVRNGAFAYILKPFAVADLLDTARRALAQVALERERARLQHELELSERKHREVVEAMPAFILALDAEGRIALWNRRLEEVTGSSRADMIGQPGVDLVKGDAAVHRLPIKNQGERLVRWERAEVALPAGAGTWTYAVGIDVTSEQDMLRRTLRAERLAAVGTLAAGLAHEVRNPLNSAKLQLAVLVRRLERGEATAASLRPVAELVEQEISRLERLVNDFLAFVQPRPLDLKPMALAELCRSVLAFVEPEASAGRVALAAELDENLPGLSADPERLKQVLLNLVRNAMEAMPDGGTLTLRARKSDGHAEIDVEDTGEGFADEAPVFDAFFTTKPQGTGLGLTIVHRIVADHGGTIRVRSRPGCTCFTIFLPVASSAKPG